MIEIIGKRVKLVGEHPHAGETGTIDRIDKTSFNETGLVIKLENCIHGTKECFVFKMNDFKLLN